MVRGEENHVKHLKINEIIQILAWNMLVFIKTCRGYVRWESLHHLEQCVQPVTEWRTALIWRAVFVMCVYTQAWRSNSIEVNGSFRTAGSSFTRAETPRRRVWLCFETHSDAQRSVWLDQVTDNTGCWRKTTEEQQHTHTENTSRDDFLQHPDSIQL